MILLQYQILLEVMQKQQALDSYLHQITEQIHQTLAQNFTHAHTHTELTQPQHAFLQQHAAHETIITRIMAIDSYVHYIMSLISKCEPLLEITGLLFTNLAEIREIVDNLEVKDVNEQLSHASSNLCKAAEIIHDLFPNSPLVRVNQKFMEGVVIDPIQAIYARLYDENQQLRSKLQQNDRQLLSIQLSLTKMIKQNDDAESIESSLKILQLREMISLQDAEIARMNEQFGIQINKYNVVYEAMKRQIQQLRSYENVNQFDVIQQLQTEIVRLREQKERDEMTIRELNDSVPFGNGSRYQSKISYSRMQY